MDMIAFPLKFESGGLRKLAEGSNEYYTQLLSICILTEPLTHPFTPQFGANDPAFRNIDKGLFILNASRFVPEVRITGLSTLPNDGGSGKTKVSFSFEILG
jgi:hypothetical protein